MIHFEVPRLTLDADGRDDSKKKGDNDAYHQRTGCVSKVVIAVHVETKHLPNV